MASSIPALAPLSLDGDVKTCCASLYENPAVRWLLGGELHPGGKELSRRAFELCDLKSGERILDVACGAGTTGLLAAEERGADVTGIDFGAGAVAEANAAAATAGLADRARFVQGDAESLPFGDGEFDAAISECALCTFPDKADALAETRRVLAPGGRIALSDVYAAPDLLPGELRGTLATVACVGDALQPGGHEALLESAGFELLARKDQAGATAVMAERVHDRLRAARIAGAGDLLPIEGGIDAAIEITRQARAAIDDGRLGYVLIVGRRD